MRAAVLHAAHQPLTIENLEIHRPGPNEVLVRTAVSGLCHSDLHFIEGKIPTPLPVVLGHEASGIVEAVGSNVTYVKPGDHVISCLSVFCGHCSYCLGGRMSLCATPEVKMPPGVARRLTWNGQHVAQSNNLSAFAEQMLVHENALAKVSPDMPLAPAALLGCGVLTGFGAVARTARVEPGATVAVVGCGGIGLSAINGAEIAGAGRIFAIDKDPGKLELARRFGATDVLQADDEVLGRIREMTGGGVEYSFECIGLKSTVELCFEMLRPGGTATVIGVLPLGVKVEVAGLDLLRERRLQGSLMGSNRFRTDIPRLVEHYQRGRLHLDDLISGKLRLDQINEGFASLQRGGVARNVIVFDH